MKKFMVKATKIHYYTTIVEANNKEEAIKKSLELNEEDFQEERIDGISVLLNSANRLENEENKSNI